MTLLVSIIALVWMGVLAFVIFTENQVLKVTLAVLLVASFVYGLYYGVRKDAEATAKCSMQNGVLIKERNGDVHCIKKDAIEEL